MGLGWYNNVRLLLKVDTLFHKDHVTAFNFLKKSKSSVKPKYDNCPKTPIVDHNKFRKAIPIPSEKFKVEKIVKRLKKTARIATVLSAMVIYLGDVNWWVRL